MNTSNIFRNAGLLVHPAGTNRGANCCCFECLSATVKKEENKQDVSKGQVSTLNTVNKSN